LARRQRGAGYGRLSDGLRACGAEFGDFEAVFRLEIAFAAEPILHGRLEAIEGDAVAGFEQAIGNGQRVVEDRIIGEVAHGEVVDPGNGAGVGCARLVDSLD